MQLVFFSSHPAGSVCHSFPQWQCVCGWQGERLPYRLQNWVALPAKWTNNGWTCMKNQCSTLFFEWIFQKIIIFLEVLIKMVPRFNNDFDMRNGKHYSNSKLIEGSRSFHFIGVVSVFACDCVAYFEMNDQVGVTNQLANPEWVWKSLMRVIHLNKSEKILIDVDEMDYCQKAIYGYWI